ncbi:MAG: hypothetical protein WBM06_22920 [Pseudolabrys sp.]
MPLTFVIPAPRMGQTIQAMQAMQLLASSGVTMAAGAMVSLSFAVSPPITLLPPRPVPIDASGNVPSQQQRTSETMGAASADTFERRWQAATDDIPPMLVRDPLEGLIGGLPTLPLAQDAPRLAQVEPSRDLLKGLIGGLPMLPLAQDAPRVTQIEPRNLAAAQQPEHQESVTVVLQEPPAPRSDVCARHGLRRVDYKQNHHRYWRCADR